jgi:hypothetical protein
MVKAVKSKTAGGEAFIIKRDKNGKIVGDYVVAKGVSLFCCIGQVNEGKPISEKNFGDGFEKKITEKQIVTRAEYKAQCETKK